MFQFLSPPFPKRKLIIAGFVFLLILSTSFFIYNQFYRQDRIGVEVLQGMVTKTSGGLREIIPTKGQSIFPGDSFEVSKDSTAALIFHDGSVLTFVAGDIIKYSNFKLVEQRNHFSFNNLGQNSNFEYITQSYLSKAGAVILGREDSLDGLTRSKVLGAVEKKLNDEEKIKMWDVLNKCIQASDTKQLYQQTLNNCLTQNNISSLESLSAQ
jgi:hypothetical protein